MFNGIKVIAFDADDTLWVNEPYFRESELQFCSFLSEYGSQQEVLDALFKVEMQNLDLYGYGTKSFMLSMVETAHLLAGNKLSPNTIGQIIDLGKQQIQKDIELLPSVAEVLAQLSKSYRIILATKGDLLDQERKLNKSGLYGYFHHIEVMSDKKVADYKRLIQHLDIEAGEFLMIGNSLKSDVIPVLENGGKAIHVPFHTTWIHEEVHDFACNGNCTKVEQIKQVLTLLK